MFLLLQLNYLFVYHSPEEKGSDSTKLSLTVTLSCSMLNYSNMDSTVALQMHGNFLYESYLITNTSGKSTYFLLY